MLHFILGLWACSPGTNAPAPAQPSAERPSHAGFAMTDPASCAACHDAIVAEWRESMHSRSHPSNDPVYAALRALRIQKQGEAVGKKCQRCHNPMAPEDPDSAAGKAGVGCGACHDAAAIDAGERPDSRKVCMRCHERAKNPAGVAVCATGDENASAGAVPCGACHLQPAEDGHVSHRFPGPHRAWYQSDTEPLSRAVAASITRVEGGVEVAVQNITGHGFPTGFPGRVAAVRLVGAGGFEAQPEELLFRKVYVDADGKPTLPPFATKLASDTRLAPGERRVVKVELPAEVKDLRAELVFRLLPGPAAEKLGLAGSEEAKPKVVEIARLD